MHTILMNYYRTICDKYTVKFFKNLQYLHEILIENRYPDYIILISLFNVSS